MATPTLDAIFDAIFRVDHDLKVHFISEPGLRWLGLEQAQSSPANLATLINPDDMQALREAIDGHPAIFSCDLRMARNDGDTWINLRGHKLPATDQYMLCIIDISGWKTRNEDFRHAAEHDELTALPNRAFLKRCVEDLLSKGDTSFSLALLDLDGFKHVNDSLGHAMGDAVLIETARRLKKSLDDEDHVVRLGGDEFVVVVRESEPLAVTAKMKKILLSIARPYDTSPHKAYLGTSIGIASFPDHGEDYTTLLKNADTSMYQSKKGGKNRVTLFTKDDENVDFTITSAIHRGIQGGEFYLHFQPQFDINRRLIGAEALMRWSSHAYGRVSPDVFIPIAEQAGLMNFLGNWALRYACHQLGKFQQLMPDFVISVNVSPVQFGGEQFDRQVLDAVAETGIDPSKLILEITESTLMQSQDQTELALAALREQGIRFSIDDFGTGFSSLAYLTRLPVSSIKIDKAFVRAIEHPEQASEADKKLISAMINLAQSVDLKVVAEGVENEHQLSYLKHSGCNLIQGYLLGKPMAADDLLALIQAQQGGAA